MVWFLKGKARSSDKKKKRVEPKVNGPQQSAFEEGSFSDFDDAVLHRAAQDAMAEVSDGLSPERKIETFITEKIAGEEPVISALSAYVPPNLIGGVLPHVGGVEDDLVIKAATQGCGTSNIFYKYSVHEGLVYRCACV